MALATTLRSSAQACRRVAPAACGNRRSIVRALNVRAFQEQNNEQQQPEQALQRQEQVGFAAESDGAFGMQLF